MGALGSPVSPTAAEDGPPTADDDTAAWQALVRTRDPALRNRLVERHLGLCRRIARALYARRGGLATEFVDYMQLATLGLIEAVDRFDPARGSAFEAFATPRIRGSVLNGLGALSERHQQISLRQRLRDERVKSLTAPMAADAAPSQARHRRDVYLELAEVAVGLALGLMLDGTGMLRDEEADAGRRQDFYDGAEQRELRASIRALVDALPERERYVIRYHYFQGLSFTEIAGLLGFSKGRISQIHQQALQLIRAARNGGGFDLLA